MKGIILAGGSGTRLAPLTNVVSKQLLPVYDKPMICYPLATLMNMGISEILIISTPDDTPNIEKYLGDGSRYGIHLSYKVQERPKGIADAFLIGEEFINNDNVCLILGDNIFHGTEVRQENIEHRLDLVKSGKIGGLVFAYNVSDPERYGVVEYDEQKDRALSIEEKPKKPKSNLAVTGLYIYDKDVVEIAKKIKPSDRGELEITDVNNYYLAKNKLSVVRLRRGFAWLDAGTPDSLLDSSSFIQTIEKRQGLKIACLEEVALMKKLIDRDKFKQISASFKKGSNYRKYLDLVLKTQK